MIIPALPEWMNLFVESGQRVATSAASLSWEYHYTLNVVITNFTGDENLLLAPVLLWLQENQPNTLQNSEAREKLFSVDILANDRCDISMDLKLTEIGLIAAVSVLIQSDDVSFMMLSSLCALPILAAMAVAMPDRTYRFMAITALTFFLVLAGYLLSLLYLSPTAGRVAVSLLVAAVMFLWLWIVSHQLKLLAGPYANAVHPLLYGIPAGLILLSFLGINAAVLMDFFWSSTQFSMLRSATGTGIAAGLVMRALSEKRNGQPLFSIITLPAALICGAAALYAPGIGLGLWLMLMARYQGSPGLLVVSGGFMVLYVICWYYFLEVILLHKALVLLAGGLVLLGLAWVVTKVLPAQIGGASENV